MAALTDGQAPSRRDGAAGELLEARLTAATGALDRQRTAIVARDASGLERATELLARRLNDLAESLLAAGALSAPQTAQVRHLREQVQLNRLLVANGEAIASHFAQCVADASPASSAGLLSEMA